LDPLIRELRRDPNPNGLTRFENWIQKAKRWEKLGNKPLNRETIIRTLIEHAQQDAIESIKQDIRVILVYLRNSVDALPCEKAEKVLLEFQIKVHLQPLFEKLQKISFNPASLNELVDQKAQFNKLRESYHDSALALIDKHLKS